MYDNAQKFFIDGQWVAPNSSETLDVINPATEAVITQVALGNQADVDAAVAAANRAFPAWSQTPVEQRVAIINGIVEGIGARADDLAATVSAEMGAPIKFASVAQVPAGLAHFATVAKIVSDYEFEQARGKTLVVKEPVGVVGMITPWNWPLNQIATKVASALAAGCTMVLKPSEVAPLNAILLAEIMDAAGVPAGVFNLVNGDGPTVGAAMSVHAGIDMMSFTGSTRAGSEVAKAAAPSIKRVAQELGGKSANIVLDSDDFAAAVARDAFGMCMNTGQSCNAGTRLLVPAARVEEAADIAAASMAKITVGDPSDEGTRMGPSVSQAQWERVQQLIQAGIDEGATLVTGGTGKPDGVDAGYFVKPTLFSNVTNDMRIAREEIFGPVLVIIGYDDVDDAVEIANDSPYGLSGYVSGPHDDAVAVAKRLRTGDVHVNGANPDFAAPFGGYKQSGNGREWGVEGLEEFFETKAILGAAARS